MGDGCGSLNVCGSPAFQGRRRKTICRSAGTHAAVNSWGKNRRMDDLKFELQEETSRGARIKVIGVGGGGYNSVGRPYSDGMTCVEFQVINTDAQALAAAKVPNRLQ